MDTLLGNLNGAAEAAPFAVLRRACFVALASGSALRGFVALASGRRALSTAAQVPPITQLYHLEPTVSAARAGVYDDKVTMPELVKLSATK